MLPRAPDAEISGVLYAAGCQQVNAAHDCNVAQNEVRQFGGLRLLCIVQGWGTVAKGDFMNIESKLIADIVPYDKNAKKHDNRQINAGHGEVY